jgi:hypothetical protein
MDGDDIDVPRFEISPVRGNPTPEEQAAILDALEALLVREQPGTTPSTGASISAWVRSGRLAARRGGILDARSVLGPASWPDSARLPWSGRGYEGRWGRGDSR